MTLPSKPKSGDDLLQGVKNEIRKGRIAPICESLPRIDSHVVVVDLDNLASPIVPEDTGTLEVALIPTAPSSGGASPVLPNAT